MIGIVLLTLGQSAKALAQEACELLGEKPDKLAIVEGGNDRPATALASELAAAIEHVNSGTGVIILADLYGCTHTNIACSLIKAGHTTLVTGLSLPMLLRTLNYRHNSLALVTDKAISASVDGVVRIDGQQHPTAKAGS